MNLKADAFSRFIGNDDYGVSFDFTILLTVSMDRMT